MALVPGLEEARKRQHTTGTHNLVIPSRSINHEIQGNNLSTHRILIMYIYLLVSTIWLCNFFDVTKFKEIYFRYGNTNRGNTGSGGSNIGGGGWAAPKGTNQGYGKTAG